MLHRKGELVGNRYEVTRFVGQGGMQEVYAAKDNLLQRRVALKSPKTSSALKRFKRSAVTAAKVNHANVAKTLDYVEDGAHFYLIEELIGGCDLSEFLRNCALVIDPYLCALTFHHLSKGLAASHHAGVVHRDLKPSNVMVVGGASFKDVKITDFGIAKMAEEELAEAVEGGDEGLTASQTAIGALPYMAPEAIESLRDAGKPADVWSLGALVYELATGRKPFGNGYKAVPTILAAKPPQLPAELLRKIQYASLVKEIYDLILACLKRNPKERPTADELVMRCEQLCYATKSREYGIISSINYGTSGFIEVPNKPSVFFHMESVFGKPTVAVGDRVWFSRHPGQPKSRAFPVVPARPIESS